MPISEPDLGFATPSTREVIERTHPQSKLLGRLMRSDALRTGDLPRAYREVTEVAASTLEVERASVWLLHPGGRSMECADLFLRSKNEHQHGMVLAADAFPAYFAALGNSRSIAAHDARTDPRTREFTASYLDPHGIRSMLDAPIIVRGETVGIICHEQLGAARQWVLWEEMCAGSLADFVALAHEVRELALREAKLAAYRDHLEHLVEARTAALQQSEESLRQVFAASPIPLVLTRKRDSTVVFANQRISDVFEVPAEEVIGQHAPDYWVSSEARGALVSRVLADGRVDGFEAELRSRSGRTFWALVSAQATTFAGEPGVLFGFYDISRQKAAELQLIELATKDALTEVSNRRRFLELIHAEFARNRRYQRPFAIAMIDADHFKGVNDRFGHDVGDEVLRRLARACAAMVRQTDTVGRYGGEEFAILFPETDLSTAVAAVERLRQAIAAEVVETKDGPVSITVSIGVATQREDDEDAAAILKRADVALYAAKSQGRDRVATA